MRVDNQLEALLVWHRVWAVDSEGYALIVNSKRLASLRARMHIVYSRLIEYAQIYTQIP